MLTNYVVAQHTGMWTLQKKGEAQLGLSGIRKELQWPQQSYTKDSSIVSVAVVLNWRSISVCQGSSEGPSPSRSVSGAPFQTLHSDRFPYSALTAPRNVQLCGSLRRTYTALGVTEGLKPGHFTHDPSSVTVLLLSPVVSLTCYKPVTFKTFGKPRHFLFRSSLSLSQALDCNDCSNSCLWNIHGCQLLWKTSAYYFNFTDLIKQNPSLQSGGIS